MSPANFGRMDLTNLSNASTINVLTVFLFCSLFIFFNPTHAEVSAKIVGGTETTENKFPYMSALVLTDRTIKANISQDEINFEAIGIENSVAENISGVLVNCGLGTTDCVNAENRVCLIERGEITFTEKVTACENGGGIGAIIHNNSPSTSTDWTMAAGIDIPAVAVTQEIGQSLLQLLEQEILLTFDSPEFTQRAFCGATLIAPEWVLTAAHCVYQTSPDSFKVNIGEFDLSDGAELAKDVKNIFIHHQYNAQEITNDIALIELEEPLVDTPVVSLATPEMLLEEITNANTAIAIGWGNQTAYGPSDPKPLPDAPEVLHEVELGLLSNAFCNQFMENLVKDDMVCAGFPEGGKSTCQGDSGGPLLIGSEGNYFQIGITSWGIGCAQAQRFGIYNRVPEFLSWINNIQNGFATTPVIELDRLNQGQRAVKTLTYTNRGNEATRATFSFSGLQAAYFSIESSTCADQLIDAGAECTIDVSFRAEKPGLNITDLNVISSEASVIGVSSRISATVLQDVSQEFVIATGGENFQWLTGGDASWIIDESNDFVKSGQLISGTAYLRAIVTGVSAIQFDWSVDSDSNVDSGSNDRILLRLNGFGMDELKGQVNWETQVIQLPDTGTHTIEWVYEKDTIRTQDYSGQDSAFLRNVTLNITQSDSITPPETQSPDSTSGSNTDSSSDSSGNMNLNILLLLMLLLTKRFSSKAKSLRRET